MVKPYLHSPTTAIMAGSQGTVCSPKAFASCSGICNILHLAFEGGKFQSLYLPPQPLRTKSPVMHIPPGVPSQETIHSIRAAFGAQIS